MVLKGYASIDSVAVVLPSLDRQGYAVVLSISVPS